MSTYVIGDIQGCLDPLQRLLAKIAFDPAQDTLWFTGDIVNRGPQSLETLRFIKQLGNKHITVLGNHDLHLLAVAYGVRERARGDTLDAILQAADRDDLLDWLRHQPLLHHEMNFTLAHAGIAPSWSIDKAVTLAKEVEAVLQSSAPAAFLQHMYGNQPSRWDDSLIGMDRLRCIVNHFTRMRFCHPDGSLELNFKGTLTDKPQDLIPWFNIPTRVAKHDKILFGHWAALSGITHTSNVYALDTGCVWGFELTAMRLEDEKLFSVKVS